MSRMRRSTLGSHCRRRIALRRAHHEVSLQQVVLDGVVRDVGVRLHAHLLQNPCAVGADGLDAQEQLRRDLGHALALGELAEDLEFALREHAVPRLARARLACRSPASRPAPGSRSGRRASPRGSRGTARRRPPSCSEPACAGAQHVQAILVLRIGAQHQRRHRLVMRLDLPQHIQSRHVGQRQVQQQHIAGRGAQQRQSLAAVLGLTGPDEVRLGPR